MLGVVVLLVLALVAIGIWIWTRKRFFIYFVKTNKYLEAQKIGDVEGSPVYAVEEGGYCKMVNAKGEVRWFQGKIADFDASKWKDYKTSDNLKLRECPLWCKSGCDENGACVSNP